MLIKFVHINIRFVLARHMCGNPQRNTTIRVLTHEIIPSEANHLPFILFIYLFLFLFLKFTFILQTCSLHFEEAPRNRVSIISCSHHANIYLRRLLFRCKLYHFLFTLHCLPLCLQAIILNCNVTLNYAFQLFKLKRTPPSATFS